MSSPETESDNCYCDLVQNEIFSKCGHAVYGFMSKVEFFCRLLKLWHDRDTSYLQYSVFIIYLLCFTVGTTSAPSDWPSHLFREQPTLHQYLPICHQTKSCASALKASGLAANCTQFPPCICFLFSCVAMFLEILGVCSGNVRFQFQLT